MPFSQIGQPRAPGEQEDGEARAVAREQAYVTMVYGLLDQAIERSEQALRGKLAEGGPGGLHQARLERDISVVEHEKRLSQLSGIERGLVFGRTDDDNNDTLYIGRAGLRDDDYELKLIDWRAPAAQPFYAATPNHPCGLVRRRHIYTRNRRVTSVDDEVFELDKLSEEEKHSLAGEAMLIATINAPRTGHMTDVVATIQAEQDRVIRSGLQGVLVVAGGPGTGKTVAALHRAAYLLYTHRRTLAGRGVLIIGPNPTFLRYISQVLPSLGETDVVLRTAGDLFPGVHATDTRDPAAVIKGSLDMIQMLTRAVRDRQLVPEADLVIHADGVPIPLARAAVARARDRARSLRKPHNVARKLFITELLGELARAEARVLDRPLDEEDVPHARARLWDEPPVRAALDALWPLLTPRRLVSDLLGSPAAIRSAAPFLSDIERDVLRRKGPAAPDAWTVADVPLLDEAAELLGTDDSAERAARRAAARQRQLDEKYAAEVLEITGAAEADPLLDAAVLAERTAYTGPASTTAERAEADRSWTYGHVIVDEAQELSAMAWRMVLRRNPARSLTVVGDLAQTSSPAGASSWEEVLGSRTRWREELLTVNYRTPVEIMAVAADVLRHYAPGLTTPESVRSEGVAPLALRAPRGELAVRTAEAVRADLASLAAGDGGRVAVIVSDELLASIAAALPEAVPGTRPEALDSPATLLTASQAKGLEFDRVVLADPAGILGQSANGGRDLYVAITRATHRLTVVYAGDLPAPLTRLAAS